MAGGEVGRLWVFLGLQASEFQQGLKAVANDIKAAKKEWASLDYIGKSMSELGSKLTKNLTLPIAGFVAATVAASNTIDEGMDIIRGSTGATGQALSQLGQTFRAVLGSVPASSEDAANAISMLSTRLSLTGQPLQQLATQMLNLARVTKSQVQPLAESMTRVFGDWSISTQQQGRALDYLYRVSQQTGTNISRLGETIVQYGAPLRQMGFSFEQAAALMGKFEAEGVNTELVLGSLRVALGKMAREDVQDPAQALSILTQRIREAGSAGEANRLAIETFGARAGPDMAAAIREGRFELDGLVQQLQASNETINKAAADTMSLGEMFTLLKNKVTLASEPVGATLTQAFQKLMPQIEAAIQKVADLANWFANLPPGIQTTIVAVVGIIAAIGPLLTILGNLTTLISGVSAALSFLAANPIVLVTAAIAALILGIVELIRHWDAVKAAMIRAWDRVTDYIQPVIDYVNRVIDAVRSAIGWLGRLFGMGGGSVSVSVSGALSRSTITTPAMASGGLVTAPGLALVGEHGPELLDFPAGARVTPLDRLAAGGQRQMNIVIQLDGRVIARAVGQPLADEIRIRTGTRL